MEACIPRNVHNNPGSLKQQNTTSQSEEQGKPQFKKMDKNKQIRDWKYMFMIKSVAPFVLHLSD